MEKIVHSTLELEHEGNEWVAQWASFIIRDGSETKDRYLSVSRKEADGSLTPVDDVYPHGITSSEARENVFQAISAARVKEIQDEYGIPTNLKTSAEVAEKVLTRVWAGEWMGQLRDSYSFYIDNLASILNQEFLQAATVVQVLRKREKAGLNGFIIVPWAEEEQAFQSWEKSTGHKRLIVSDCGAWSCSHCGQSRDEREEPASQIPCVPAPALVGE